MTVQFTQALSLKVGDLYIEKDSRIPLEIIAIFPGTKKEPLGVYYTGMWPVPVAPYDPDLIQLTLKKLTTEGKVGDFFLTLQKQTPVLAAFPEKNK